MLSRSQLAGGALGPDPAIARATADIERTREQLLRSVASLRQAVIKRSDWREWIRQRPGEWLLGAIAAGYVIGRLARRK